MNKTLKWTLVFASIGAVGFVGVKAYQKSKTKLTKASKEDQVNTIISSGKSGGPASALLGLADDYIKAWYIAVVTNQPTFIIGTSLCNTTGGKTIQTGVAPSASSTSTGNDDFSFWDIVKHIMVSSVTP